MDDESELYREFLSLSNKYITIPQMSTDMNPNEPLLGTTFFCLRTVIIPSQTRENK